MQRHSRRMEDEMVARQRQERIRLPKNQQKEAKIRMSMFKQSLRISSVYQDTAHLSATVSNKDKIKQVRIETSRDPADRHDSSKNLRDSYLVI